MTFQTEFCEIPFRERTSHLTSAVFLDSQSDFWFREETAELYSQIQGPVPAHRAWVAVV